MPEPQQKEIRREQTMDQETLETRLKQESKPKGSSADPKPAAEV